MKRPRLSASGCAQRAELPETVQDVLKTKYNITLPEMDTPEFLQNLTIFGSGGNDTARRGIMARKRGLRPKHPVVIIPGVLGLGLGVRVRVRVRVRTEVRGPSDHSPDPQRLLSNSDRSSS